MTNCNYYIAEKDSKYYLKLTGRNNYMYCSAFKEFVDELISKSECQNIFIDLTEVDSIDSTNLGILAKLANFMLQKHNKKPVIYSTNEDINVVLQSIGFNNVFTIIDQNLSEFNENYSKLDDKKVTKEDLNAILYEAHYALSNLNSENQKVFAEVIDILHKKLTLNR